MFAKITAVAEHGQKVIQHGRSFPGILLTIGWNAFPIAVWMVGFRMARHIPDSIRPVIDVTSLTYLNQSTLSPTGVLILCLMLLGPAYQLKIKTKRTRWSLLLLAVPGTLKTLDVLAQTNLNPTAVLDVLAFIPYGVLHFICPFVMSLWIWLYAPSGMVGVFTWALGWQNTSGLITHLLFPNAAPWYTDLAGTFPPPAGNYSMAGNPAGLIRVDDVFGTHLYRGAFKMSPVVFGAFPSLHAATATISCLFVARYAPRPILGLVVAVVYWCWMLWSTIYLRHHFVIDLVGGAFYSAVAFSVAHRVSFPQIDARAAMLDETGYAVNAWERLVGSKPVGDDAHGLTTPDEVEIPLFRESERD